MLIRKIKNHPDFVGTKISRHGGIPQNAGKIKDPINIFVFLVCVFYFLFLVFGFLSYAQENLDELKKTLLEQERQIAEEQKEKIPKEEVSPSKTVEGNKGYLYASGSGEIREGRPVYIMPDTQALIDNLYREAVVLFGEGKFQEAKVKLEEVIRLNPLHIPARSLIKRIIDEGTELSFQDTMIDAKEKILEVDKAWLPPARKEEEEKPVEKKAPAKTPQQIIMEEKANQIIPEINFTDAHIRDVLKYLSDISGMNIVIDEDIFPKMPRAEKVPSEVEVTETEEVETIPTAQEGIFSDRITISLVNIPLIEALKYILSAKGLKYRIDEYAIVISTPERLAGVEMETRYYHLSTGVGIFTEFAKKVKEEGETGKAERGLKTEAKITIKDVLEQSGVPFPPGSKVFLDKRTGTLIVRNMSQNLVLVEEVLRMLDITPYQVEIEARFVEIKQETAQELGLEWMITSSDFRFGHNNQFRLDNKTTDIIYGQYPDPTGVTGREGITHGLRYLDTYHEDTAYPYNYTPRGNIISISGVLTKPEFRMILHALNQSGYANVLSAPKVTTLNNQQALIEVVREIIYPTEFELTPATTNDWGNIVTQPVVTPAAYKTRDVGITLNVTPSVGADKKTINLNLKPEVSQFKKWEDYGIPADPAGKWDKISIKQPIFFTENVETSVVINDGETVVLGGLVKENTNTKEDKIPLLGDIPVVGRLFRTNSEETTKTNLMIFVTANLLTPTGERIRKE